MFEFLLVFFVFNSGEIADFNLKFTWKLIIIKIIHITFGWEPDLVFEGLTLEGKGCPKNILNYSQILWICSLINNLLNVWRKSEVGRNIFRRAVKWYTKLHLLCFIIRCMNTTIKNCFKLYKICVLKITELSTDCCIKRNKILNHLF